MATVAPSPSTPIFSTLITRAIELAAGWHDGTYRKISHKPGLYEGASGEHLPMPVMAHLTAVAMLVARAGWDEATVAAAFLHDALEDANRHHETLSYETLEAHIGAEVASLVRDVTEVKNSGGTPRDWAARKRGYLDHLRSADPRAVAISLADKLHNLRSLNECLIAGMDVFSKHRRVPSLNAGPAEQRWFFRSVLSLASDHSDPRLTGLEAELASELASFESGLQKAGLLPIE